ncbi:MAG: hypothetical protein J0L78_13875 [Planctomycetes bacterium]|nr:hypothetical protein [Planctomycetota bacterium]
MKPHPKIRKVAKWAAAMFSSLLVLLWAGSAWWETGWYRDSGLNFYVHAGKLRGSAYDTEHLWDGRGEWYIERADRRFEWWFDVNPNGGMWNVGIPLWLFALPALLGTAAAFRLDTLAGVRARGAKCSHCGYDRSATPAKANCPECGTPKNRSRPNE